MDQIESKIVDFLYKEGTNSIDTRGILEQFDDKLRKFIEANVTLDSVYQLFPYSNPKYDPEKALIEIKESSNNLNTRLSNLKKINKSLNTFEENSSSLNWEELQNISKELKDDYKEN